MNFSIDLNSSSQKRLILSLASLSSVILVSTYLVIKYSETNNYDEIEDDIQSQRSLLHNKFHTSKVPTNLDYIVIGSGMSGLSCAAVLSRLGNNVLVLEQHPDTCGGGTHMFELKGYHFDSGLHYTVPWSVPIFALTTGKIEKDVCQFELMGDSNSTVDKINLVDMNNNNKLMFEMKYKEKHMKELYDLFPEEKDALDKFIIISNNAMLYVKVFIGLRLLPKWLQKFLWKYIIPKSVSEPTSLTAKELLPKITSNKLLISLLSSMWIDTGARPDRASFMLTAAVFRGISMEGGCYPSNGSENLAKELIPLINKNGSVLIRAPVKEIIVENNKVIGVKMDNNEKTIIKCKKGVISSCGYINTFNKLVSNDIVNKYSIPKSLPIPQSAGFVMCNIGINANPSEVGITNTNTWHIPVDDDNDAFPMINKYFEDPLGDDVIIPAFITFPSVKENNSSSSNKISCQMLLMANYEWFEKYKVSADDTKNRIDGYEEIKQKWKQKALAIFLKYFPLTKDKIDVFDVSTPLSIEHYLKSPQGGAVGLDVIPERFINPEVRELLDPVTKIPGLYLTGQDTILCGVTLCQLAGVITAFRITGFFAATKILLTSIIQGIIKG